LPRSKSEAVGDPEVTRDAFLDGALTLLQPRRGYRAGSDAILLAAAVPALAGDTILDVGAGVGAVALALARRLPEVRVDGIELQAALAALGAENARLNRLDERVRLVPADLAAPPSTLPSTMATEAYGHVVSNPPYHDGESARRAPAPSRALARSESHVPLAQWIELCLRRLRPGGTLSLIHRADRLDEVLAALRAGAGGVIVFPLWPGRGRPAKRLITRAVKESRAPLTVASGLVLHRADGAYTKAAKAVLRQGAALALGQGEA
jgi:tRNA1(Val) A37 N6-methylase TrmN6